MWSKFWALAGLSFFLIWSCTINEPEPPVWDTSWKIELPLKQVTMKELINDSTLVADTTNGTPTIRINFEDSTDWEYVQASDLTIHPANKQFQSEIGTIKLEKHSEVRSSDITLDELLPANMLTSDTIPPHPPTTVSPETKEATFDFYERAVIKSGTMYLTVHNDLFLKIDAGMRVDIYNNNQPNPQLITSIVFSSSVEPYGVTQSDVVDLSGLEVSNHFLLKYTIPIAGADTMTIITDEQRNGTLYSILTLENVEVSEADAKVPEQSFTNEEKIALPSDNHRIVEAKIKEGSITLNIQNELPVYSNTIITLPEILENGQAKQIQLNLQPDENTVQQIDLAGYEIKNISHPGEPLDSILIQVEATVSSNGQIVTIKETDQIQIDVSFTDIVFEKISGILQPVNVNLENTSIDVGDFFENINGSGLILDDLQLKIVVENQLDIPVHLLLTLTAQNGSETRVLNIDEWIKAKSEAPFTEIILDKNYENPYSIVDLFAILPKTLEMQGQAVIEGEGSIELGQGVRALYTAESPLFFKLQNPITYQSDLDSIKKEDIDQDTRDRLRDDLEQAKFNLIIKNGTPFATEFNLILADDSLEVNNTTITDSTRKIVIKATIDRGLIGTDGYVTEAVENNVEINLTNQQMELFQKSPIYMGQKVVLLPTGDQQVKVRTTDTIEVQGFIQINFTVRFE